MSKTISVVVPVYNNQPTLEETCRQIVEVHAAQFSDVALEIMFVNDGSTDGSWDELQGLKKRYPDKITLLALSRNFGQLGALLAGFRHASGEAVICVSADLQDPISLIGKMVDYWKNGIEIVVCHRQSRNEGVGTRLLSRFAYAIERLTYPELPKGGFDYWLMSGRVRDLMCSCKGRHNFLQGYLLSMGFTQAFIPYERQARTHGKSGYRLGKKIKIALDFLVDSSTLIRFMSSIGVLVSLAGVVYSLLIVYAWAVHQTPFSGWAPLMMVLLLGGGMSMTMLGVLGEYIWRIYDNTRDFPLFIVENKEPALDVKAGTDPV